MRDLIWPMGGKQPLHRLGIAKITFDQGIARVHQRERNIPALARRAIVIVEIIDTNNFIAARQQCIGQVAADKSGAAGYEIPHVNSNSFSTCQAMVWLCGRCSKYSMIVS